MTRKLPPAAVLADTPDDVEARFYAALQRADIAQMMAVWADDDEIVCVHPGGTRAIGPAAVRAMFEAVFAGGGIAVRPEQVHRLQQLGCALHHLVERVVGQQPAGAEGRAPAAGQGSAGVAVAPPVCVLATNVYVKTAAGWRLCAHHASPGQPGALGDVAGQPHGGTGRHGRDGPATLH